MTNVKQLYSLQELDLTLDRIQDETAKAENELRVGPTVAAMETALQEETDRLQELQSQRRLHDLEVESQRARSAHLDAELFGGAVTNPRGLEDMEQEASRARELLQRQDTELLELSALTEESQTKRDALEQQLADTQSAWETRRAELEKQTGRLAAEQEEVAAKRDSLAATLDATAIGQYEHLRRAKAGLAVAKMERGLCQACWMALPTHLVQRVRSGRQTSLCTSCGRLLLLG